MTTDYERGFKDGVEEAAKLYAHHFDCNDSPFLSRIRSLSPSPEKAQEPAPVCANPWAYSCCDCSLQSPDPWALSWWRMALHLLRHRLHGDRVPLYAFRRLWRDRNEVTPS